MAVKRMYCNDCKKYVLAERQPVNHVLHLLLTIVSFGLWLIVWILVSLSQEPWRCPNCVTATDARESLISPDHSRLVRGSVAMLIVGVALFFASTKDKDSDQRQATGATSISDESLDGQHSEQPARSSTFRQAEQGQAAEMTGPSEIPAGEYFVAAKVLNVRLCPSYNCPSPDALLRRQKVPVYERKDKWARISKYYDSSAEQLKFPEIDEPRIARWVAIEFLSRTEPSGQAKSDLVFGRWCDKWLPSKQKLKSEITLILTAAGKVEERLSHSDGSSNIFQLNDLGNGVYAKVNSRAGDKVRIVPTSGDLELIDNDGLIRTARRLENNLQPGDCLP